MDPIATLALMLGILLVALAMGIPVAFAFLAINIGGLCIAVGPHGLSLLAGSAYTATASFALAPIALFILMGELLMRSGLATLTVEAVDNWIGRLPGRLAVAAVGGGTIFGAVSGSSMASVAMLGSTLIGEMERQRYRPNISVSAILAAGGLAVLIPPSMLGVFLGAVANVSIGRLLIAGVIPGLLLAAVYAAYFIIRAWLQPHLAPPYALRHITWRDRLRSLLYLVPLGGLMMVVTGFIFLGVATASETAALGVVASLAIVTAFRRLSWKVVADSLMATVSTTAMVLMIIVGSSAYSQLLAMTGAISAVLGNLTGIGISAIQLVLLVNLIILVLGCFIDTISIMLIVLPIFLPVANAIHVDLIWFCLIILINLELAGITPPFGVLLFVMKGVQPCLSMTEIYSSVGPIVVIQLLLMLAITFYPGIATWLPNVMYQ